MVAFFQTLSASSLPPLNPSATKPKFSKLSGLKIVNNPSITVVTAKAPGINDATELTNLITSK